jgi:hypothetical protein
LHKWDRFACGENSLAPELKQATPEFEEALTRLLTARDLRAPARLVFYAVVQVGGFIPVDSPLGKASKPILGDDFKVFTNKLGIKYYFAADLYFWWLDNRSRFEASPIFEEWRQREFAQSVVIPGYHRMVRVE